MGERFDAWPGQDLIAAGIRPTVPLDPTGRPELGDVPRSGLGERQQTIGPSALVGGSPTRENTLIGPVAGTT